VVPACVRCYCTIALCRAVVCPYFRTHTFALTSVSFVCCRCHGDGLHRALLLGVRDEHLSRVLPVQFDNRPPPLMVSALKQLASAFTHSFTRSFIYVSLDHSSHSHHWLIHPLARVFSPSDASALLSPASSHHGLSHYPSSATAVTTHSGTNRSAWQLRPALLCSQAIPMANRCRTSPWDSRDRWQTSHRRHTRSIISMLRRVPATASTPKNRLCVLSSSALLSGLSTGVGAGLAGRSAPTA
jgi:hypothetical protein